MFLVRWLASTARRLVERYRTRRDVRFRAKMQRFVEEANRPESIAQVRRWAEKKFGRLVLNDGGFRHEKNGKTESTVQWDAVRTIRTFKDDCWCYDRIYLEFEIGDDTWIEVFENIVDFRVVVADMERRFPGIPEDWYVVVRDPPYAPNPRILWRRDETCSEVGGGATDQ